MKNPLRWLRDNEPPDGWLGLNWGAWAGLGLGALFLWLVGL